MSVSIGNTFPAPEIPEGHFVQRFSHRLGHIEKLAQRLARKAARWLAGRRAWSPRVTAPGVNSPPWLTGELEGVRREMLERTGVGIAIGASRSRGVARTASRLAGAAGVVVVPPGRERGFLAPLPLRRLEDVPEATLTVLEASGLVTIGELQRVPKAVLQAEFGAEPGVRLWRAARGMDSEPDAESRANGARWRRAASERCLPGNPRHAARRDSLFADGRGQRTGLMRKVRLMAGTLR